MATLENDDVVGSLKDGFTVGEVIENKEYSARSIIVLPDPIRPVLTVTFPFSI